VYDKEKEDSPFAAEQTPPTQGFSNQPPYLLTRKSVTSQNQKLNPVAAYKMSNSRINAFAFSPSGTHIAVVSEDGTLRILDFHNEQITDVFPSYYGGLTCVAWSPDGVYIATGGQDDLITIWSVADRILVARCVGHHSWVSAVEFDRWRCDDRSYRFGSVGQDGRLCLWDFNIGMLRRPRVGSTRPSVSSAYPFGAGGSRNASSTTLSKLNSASQNSERSRRLETVSTADDEERDGLGDGVDLSDDVMHVVVSRSQVATLPPVMSKIIDEHALVGMTFEEDYVVTTCKRGMFVK
jgi:WD40 repeat protein